MTTILEAPLSYGDPVPPGYALDQWAYLRFLAYECEAAYAFHPTIEADGVEVRVTEDDHENLIFAFRGTTFDGADIIRDIRALPWWSDELKTWCHHGFLKGARAILPHIQDILKLYDNHVHPPYVSYLLVGHSKGGAEATLVAALMVRLGKPPRALVTYGAPYAGGPGIRQALKNVPGHRVVNRGDPVPHVPWLLNKLGVFEHHRGETQVDTSINIWAGSPANHRIDNYIDALGYSYGE